MYWGRIKLGGKKVDFREIHYLQVGHMTKVARFSTVIDRWGGTKCRLKKNNHFYFAVTCSIKIGDNKKKNSNVTTFEKENDKH